MQIRLDRILVYQVQGSGSWMVAVDNLYGCSDFAWYGMHTYGVIVDWSI